MPFRVLRPLHIHLADRRLRLWNFPVQIAAHDSAFLLSIFGTYRGAANIGHAQAASR